MKRVGEEGQHSRGSSVCVKTPIWERWGEGLQVMESELVDQEFEAMLDMNLTHVFILKLQQSHLQWCLKKMVPLTLGDSLMPNRTELTLRFCEDLK